MNSTVPYGALIRSNAARRGDDAAVIAVSVDGEENSITWAALDERSERAAAKLAGLGAAPRAVVAVELGNGLEHYVACVGAWKAGACVLPLDPNLPNPLRTALLAMAEPVAVVSGRDPTSLSPSVLEQGSGLAPDVDAVAAPGKAIGSGGSTGNPKLIVDPRPWAFEPGRAAGELGRRLGMRPGQVQLVAGPLFHNTSFTWSHLGLADGHTLVVMGRFEPGLAWELLERHRVHFAGLVPTMMKRMLDVTSSGHDLPYLEGVFHSGGPCPDAVKRGWLNTVGATRLHEAYGATESTGATIIRGDEWLAHPGSVGQPFGCDLEIRREDGIAAEVGEVGEVFMRPAAADQGQSTFVYLGAPPGDPPSDGYVSVGDLGWLDADGYLYLADRRTDLIVSGGVNVYPAEVEGALLEHPDVADVVVIGLPDDEWGHRVHAVVQCKEGRAPADEDLRAFVRERLQRYKVPKSFEFVAALPRNEAGKLNRIALRESRSVQVTEGADR